MGAYSVDCKKGKSEEYPAFQLCYLEYILETIDNAHDIK